MTPVVVVYGRPAGTPKKTVRIGTGTLPIRDLVLPDAPLSDQLGRPNPPHVSRVGIGWLIDGAPQVQVIDVAQVLLSEPGVGSGPQIWGFDLAERAEGPGESELMRSDPGTRPHRLRELDLSGLVEHLRLRPSLPNLPTPTRPVPPAEADPPEETVVVPAGLWCFLFPRASFCR